MEPENLRSLTRARRRWGTLQGLYFMFGGLWPLLSLGTFEAVTGNKRDEWLVRTVAGLLVVMGTVLLRDALLRRRISSSSHYIGAGAGMVLGLVGITSGMTGTISWLYVPDGIIHMSFSIGWLLLTNWAWARWNR